LLAEENKLGPARSVLEDHNLTSSFEALQVFPGGWIRRAWLFRQYDRIFASSNDGAGRRGTRNAVRHAARNTVKIIAGEPRDKRPLAPAAAATRTPGLPL